MAISSVTQTRSGNVTTVIVVSTLTGTVYYHWYLDGSYLGVTQSPSRTLYIDHEDMGRLDVLDTNDADFDPIENAPDEFPARRNLFFVRSVDVDVVKYRIEQQVDGGAWETAGYVQHDSSRWSYLFLTDRLDDLSDYAWRVVPIDAAGNEGTALTLAAERIVRRPDAPEFVATFDDGTTEVLFEEG